MPNHCENELLITGPRAELTRFKEFAKGEGKDSPMDFNKFIPYPDKYKRMDEECPGFFNEKFKDTPEAEKKKLMAAYKKKYGTESDGYNSGGYDWCYKNWGTKWNAYSQGFTETSRSIFYSFDTAWAPPEPVIANMATRFPKLKFKHNYYEGGSGFCGKAVYKEGKEHESTYNDQYRGRRGG